MWVIGHVGREIRAAVARPLTRVRLLTRGGAVQMWVELHSKPSAKEQDMLDQLISAWYTVGRVGGYEGSNLQARPLHRQASSQKHCTLRMQHLSSQKHPPLRSGAPCPCCRTQKEHLPSS